MLNRLTSNIAKTSEVLAIIEKVKAYYKHAIKDHTVLARATLLGLEILAKHPERLIEVK